MEALQAQPQTSAELAAQFGVSDRHIRRTIADLILEKKVSRERNGRDFLYSLAAAVVEEDAASSSITGLAGNADNCGPCDLGPDRGHSSDSGEGIADDLGPDRGHEKHQSSKNRYRNRRKKPEGYGHPPKGLRIGPEFGPLRDADQSELFPDGLAHFERDRVQFVLIDKKFRDILYRRSEQEEKWEVRKKENLRWIVIPGEHLTLQIGSSTTTFYSDEPGDLSTIAAWVRKEFTDYYDDIESLVSRVKYPHGYSVEELCVVITDPAIISNIRVSIAKDAVNGVYNLPRPGGSRPGLKIYERDGTMRVELITTSHAEAVVALGMRENLMSNLPRMRKIPGLFWEFVQHYYSALHHPIIIDTGGHEFLAALHQMSGQFTDALRTIADKIPTTAPAPTAEDLALKDLKAAIEALETGELADIIRTFREMLNVEEAPTKVFLAAWTVWAKRNFKGRVIKADVASLLLRANDPVPAADIADALVRLRQVGLLQQDERLEICFSPEGAELARILTAKREGV